MGEVAASDALTMLCWNIKCIQMARRGVFLHRRRNYNSHGKTAAPRKIYDAALRHSFDEGNRKPL
jgi:hypothetical protein